MKLAQAVWASVGLHAAAILVLAFGNAHPDTEGLAQPPVSNLQARIFTYQKSEVMQTSVAPEAAASPAEPRPDLQPRSAEAAALPKAPADTGPPKAAAETIPDSASLDASPVLVSSVTLEYPPAANNREGLVTLAIVVAGNGAVEDVSVVKAVPPGFFEAAAVAGFRNARFTPGLLGGLGVKSRMLIEVEFMPTNRGGAVSGQR